MPDRSSTLRGDCWKRGSIFFSGGLEFKKKKLKSGIFNNKRSLYTKIFFSIITKNSHWEVLTNNLVTFKR